MVGYGLAGKALRAVCTGVAWVMTRKACFTVEPWIVVLGHAWTKRGRSDSELGGITRKTLGGIGTSLAPVPACFTQLIGHIIIILRHTRTPDIIHIKNPKFSGITTWASSGIRTQLASILTWRTGGHLTLIKLRLASTSICVVECASGITGSALSGCGCAIYTWVITLRAFFDSGIEVALFTGALVYCWV